MRRFWWALVVPAACLVGCQWNSYTARTPFTPERKAAVEEDVRRFAAGVAHDVTQDGPIAWEKHFSGSPSFFMAVNGKVAFPSGQAAAQALPEVAHIYKHIELHWGSDLRVDVLAPDLAVMATSYDEVQDYADGHRGASSGYFTAVTELQNGQWQFRDAHWSEAVLPAKAP